MNVPTIASATDTYKRCIRNGVNGMLASSSDEWYSALKSLLDDRNLYENVCRNAYQHVRENYAPQATANEAMRAYRSIMVEYHK